MVDLHNASCFDILSRYYDNIDVIITSPPYNLGINYNQYNDSKAPWQYIIWLENLSKELYKCLKEDGSLFLVAGGCPSEPLRAFTILDSFIDDFQLQNAMYWIKSISIDKRPVKGHIKPINSKRFLNDAVEMVFHLTKTKNVEIDRLSVGCPYADASNLTRGTRGKNGNLRCKGNAWFYPYKTINSRNKSRGLHPATFELSLVEDLIKLHGMDRCQTVMDPLAGSGTVGEAALKFNKDFVGIEIDKLYFDFMKNRLDIFKSDRF